MLNPGRTLPEEKPSDIFTENSHADFFNSSAKVLREFACDSDKKSFKDTPVTQEMLIKEHKDPDLQAFYDTLTGISEEDFSTLSSVRCYA